MGNKMKKILIVVNIVLLFVITGFSAQKEESYKKLDSYFYLELRPVDPRSLLQGDYMTLNYDILDQTTEFIYQNKSYDYYEEERKEEKCVLRFFWERKNVGKREGEEIGTKERK